MMSSVCPRIFLSDIRIALTGIGLSMWLSIGLQVVRAGDLSRAIGQQQETQLPLRIVDSPLRNWTSADGRFKQSGKLLELVGDSVRLETADGQILVVVTAKLCDDDQKFIRQESDRVNQESNPFVVENKSPRQPMPKKTNNDELQTEATESTESTEFENVIPNFINVTNISLDSEASIDLQASHWRSTTRKPVKSFRVPAFSIHSRITGHCANQGETMFAVSMHEPFGVDLVNSPNSNRVRRNAQNEGTTTKSWVDVVTLPTGKSKGRFSLPSDQTVLGDIDSNGERLLAFDGVFSREPKIYVYKLQDQKLTLAKQWNSTHQNGRQEKAESARFLDDNHVVVQYGGHLQVWQLNPLEPKWTVDNDMADWQLANDRRHAMVGKSNQRFEVDLLAGECTGKLGESISETQGTPSSDGTLFAKLNRSILTISNAQGQVQSSFYSPVFWPEPTVVWIDEQTLRIDSPNQMHYVDLPRRVLFVEIVNGGQSGPLSGWQVEKTQHDGTHFVSVNQITSPGSQSLELESYRRKLPSDPSSLELLKAGDRVRLTIKLEATPDKATFVRQQLEKLLKSKGVIIDSSAPDEVRASSNSKDEEVEYRRFGVPPWAANGVEKVKIRRVDQLLELVRENEVVFRHSTTSGPGFMISIRDGETAQQAADRQCGDPVDFWKNLELPQIISRHPNGQAWTRLMKQNDKYVELKD